jgi:hypothetical protein
MITYLEDKFDAIDSKQKETRPYGQDQFGYGRKIATRYMVRIGGRGPWYRVYCTCFSNVGSVWVTIKGVVYHIRHDENLRINGVWTNEEE